MRQLDYRDHDRTSRRFKAKIFLDVYTLYPLALQWMLCKDVGSQQCARQIRSIDRSVPE